MPQLAPVVLLLAFLLLLYFGPNLKAAKSAKSVKAGAGPKQAPEKTLEQKYGGETGFEPEETPEGTRQSYDPNFQSVI